MKLKKGTVIEVKGLFGRKWKEFIVVEDFETTDERWKLYDKNEKEDFQPLGDRCMARIDKKLIWEGDK